MKLTKYQEELRFSIQELENNLNSMHAEDNNIFTGDSEAGEKIACLKHHFADGLYGREILLKKDTAAIGKIHKKDCFLFIMSGEVVIVTEDGNKKIKGPCMFPSLAGTKKVAYALTDVVWIDVYANKENSVDLKVIEDNVIAKNYLEYEEYKQIKE